MHYKEFFELLKKYTDFEAIFFEESFDVNDIEDLEIEDVILRYEEAEFFEDWEAMGLIENKEVIILSISNGRHAIDLYKEFEDNLYCVVNRRASYPYGLKSEKHYWYRSDALEEAFIQAYIMTKFGTRHPSDDTRRQAVIELLQEKAIVL